MEKTLFVRREDEHEDEHGLLLRLQAALLQHDSIKKDSQKLYLWKLEQMVKNWKIQFLPEKLKYHDNNTYVALSEAQIVEHIYFEDQLKKKYPRLVKEQPEHAQLIISLMPHSIRSLDKWEAPSRNIARSLECLHRYLFAKYPVPRCLEMAFLEREEAYVQWYIDISQGKSWRHVQNSPIPISNKMGQILFKAPYLGSMRNTLRWAQAVSMGASELQAKAIAEAENQVANLLYLENCPQRLRENIELVSQPPEAFFQSVVAFFIQNKSLGTENYAPILDYVFHQKYHLLNDAYSMSGRTAAAIIRDVNAWHRQLHYRKIYQNLPHNWPFVKIGGLQYEEGTAHNLKVYVVRQLNNQRELFEEGSSLNHCVATYISKCVNGYCSIWTMERETLHSSKEKLLTIEVASNKRVIQVRGKFNRLPTEEEKKILLIWFAREKLICGLF